MSQEQFAVGILIGVAILFMWFIVMVKLETDKMNKKK